MIVDEDLGYSHELIFEAISQSKKSINSKYHYRVNLFAVLVQQFFENKQVDIVFQKSSDPVLMLLESLVKKSGYKEAALNFNQYIGDLIKDYNQNPIEATYDKIMVFLKQGIVLHLICKESFDFQLFSAEELANYVNCLDFNDNQPQAVLSALRLSMDKSKAIPYSIIFEFTRLTDRELQNAAIFLSYELSVDNEDFKRELLISHYLLVKKVVYDFKDIYGQLDLTNQILENLFQTAIILYYCGYSKSLRLPKSETIAYSKEILKQPSIEKEFKEIFDEVGSVRIDQIHLKFRLWVLLLISMSFLILHWVYEIYPPLEYSFFGVQFTIPHIPAFLVTAIILIIIALSYYYRLERRIIKKLRRGNIRQ